MTKPVTLAAVAGAHGITGEMRLKLFAQSIESLSAHKAFEAGGRTLTLKSLRPDKIGAVARFAEITDRTAAEKLRGTLLTVPRESLPPLGEGEYYHADIIGLTVLGPDGAPIGTVGGIENYGAGDILDITLPDGKSVMVPFRPDAVTQQAEALVIDPIWLE